MITYLLELRRRLLRCLIVFFGLFVLCFIKANLLYLWLVQPLTSQLAPHQSLIATEVTSALFTPLQLAFNLAILGSTPFLLYQIWCFVTPALYPREKLPLRFFLISSLLLFILGLLFCFYLILPFMFQFFIQALPPGVALMPDMANTLRFITRMLLTFGLCFQVPLLCCLAVQSGLCHLETLLQIRPYAIVMAFVIGMILTPPDVLSQIMLALPLWGLYEIGILICRIRLSQSPFKDEVIR